MKRLSLALFLIVAALGCAPSTGNDGGVQSVVKPPTNATKPTPDATKPPAGNNEPTKENDKVNASGDVKPTTVKAGDIPNRLYQLRDLQRVTIKLNGHALPAWVMDTESKIQEGLMWVTDKDMKESEAMLFLMSEARDKESFWMQNTVLPLDIIYISPKKEVVSVAHGKPFDETGLPSEGLTLFVVEVRSGVAAKLGVKKGSKVEIPKTVSWKY